MRYESTPRKLDDSFLRQPPGDDVDELTDEYFRLSGSRIIDIRRYMYACGGNGYISGLTCDFECRGGEREDVARGLF